MPTRSHQFQTALAVVAAWCALAIGSSQPTCAGLVGYQYFFSGIDNRGGSGEDSNRSQGEFSTLSPDYGGLYTSHAAMFDVVPGVLRGSVGAGSSRARDARTVLGIYFDDLLYFTTTAPPPPREGEGDIPPGEFPGDGPQWATGSLNFHFSGQMTVSTSALYGSPLYGPEYAAAALDMSILGINERLAFARLGSFPETDVGLGIITPGTGTRIADVQGDGTSSQFEIPSNVLLPFRLTLTLDANTYNGGLSSLDFMNTASFPTSGPVFNLPDGWTVNSLSGSIVNNQFVGVNSVPEPASATLLALGAVGVFGIRRKVRR